MEKFKVDCVQDLLWRWREVLPPGRREALEKIGDPRACRAALAAPDESPLTSADFTNKPIEEVIAFLKSWQPSGQPARITINALGQAVRAAAMAQPETFSTAADQFSGLRPIYIRRLLEGLQQAAGSRKKINWQNVLALIAFTYTKASSITGGAPLAEGDDATFAWACKAAAELLMAGLRLGTSAIGVEHRAAIRSLVKGTLELVPATVEVENFADKFEEYPYFTAQQTFCGVATELCVLLIRWEQLNAASVSGSTKAAIREDPEIRKALEALLADRSSDGCIPRAIIGRYLQLLHWSDQEWVRSHVPILFPKDNSALRQATWYSHLMNDGGPISALMRELDTCYAEEIARLGTNRADATDRDFRQHRLAEYMMVLVLTGAASPDLLTQFLEKAPDELRQRAMWFLGNQVSRPTEDISEEMRQRGLAYWEMRLAVASASSRPNDYRLELGTIEHWCFHGMLDEFWLSNRLLGMLRTGLFPNNGYYTIEWLVKLAARDADRAVEILFGLVQHADENRWVYLTNQTAIRSILSEGRDKGRLETLNLVSRTVSYLASLGDGSYLDLDLPKPDA